jgi:hypothetical protein
MNESEINIGLRPHIHIYKGGLRKIKSSVEKIKSSVGKIKGGMTPEDIDRHIQSFNSKLSHLDEINQRIINTFLEISRHITDSKPNEMRIIMNINFEFIKIICERLLITHPYPIGPIESLPDTQEALFNPIYYSRYVYSDEEFINWALNNIKYVEALYILFNGIQSNSKHAISQLLIGMSETSHIGLSQSNTKVEEFGKIIMALTSKTIDFVSNMIISKYSTVIDASTRVIWAFYSFALFEQLFEIFSHIDKDSQDIFIDEFNDMIHTQGCSHDQIILLINCLSSLNSDVINYVVTNICSKTHNYVIVMDIVQSLFVFDENQQYKWLHSMYYIDEKMTNDIFVHMSIVLSRIIIKAFKILNVDAVKLFIDTYIVPHIGS